MEDSGKAVEEVADENEEECVVCMEEKINSTFPCGHCVCCFACASCLHSCPQCRAKGNAIRLYGKPRLFPSAPAVPDVSASSSSPVPHSMSAISPPTNYASVYSPPASGFGSAHFAAPSSSFRPRTSFWSPPRFYPSQFSTPNYTTYQDVYERELFYHPGPSSFQQAYDRAYERERYGEGSWLNRFVQKEGRQKSWEEKVAEIEAAREAEQKATKAEEEQKRMAEEQRRMADEQKRAAEEFEKTLEIIREKDRLAKKKAENEKARQRVKEVRDLREAGPYVCCGCFPTCSWLFWKTNSHLEKKVEKKNLDFVVDWNLLSPGGLRLGIVPLCIEGPRMRCNWAPVYGDFSEKVFFHAGVSQDFYSYCRFVQFQLKPRLKQKVYRSSSKYQKCNITPYSAKITNKTKIRCLSSGRCISSLELTQRFPLHPDRWNVSVFFEATPVFNYYTGPRGVFQKLVCLIVDDN